MHIRCPPHGKFRRAKAGERRTDPRGFDTGVWRLGSRGPLWETAVTSGMYTALLAIFARIRCCFKVIQIANATIMRLRGERPRHARRAPAQMRDLYSAIYKASPAGLWLINKTTVSN